LGNPSAGVADLAQQQIIWNFLQAFNLTSSLANGLQRATTTNARIRCFSILAYMEKLDTATWSAVLSHSDGGLVSYALHHLSRMRELPEELLPQIDALLASDLAKEDVRVAKELIYLAGNHRPAQARKVADLLSAHREIRGIDTLLDFIGNDRIDGLVEAMLGSSDDQLHTSLDRLMPRVSPQGQTRFASSIESANANRPSWHYRLARQLSRDPKTASILKESTSELLVQQAKSSLRDTTIPSSVRSAALEYLLARMSDADDVDWLLEIAKNANENDWAYRVIDGVFRLGSKTHPQLLSILADVGPAARNAIVSVMVSQPKSALLLLDQIEASRIPKDIVQPSQLEYLRNQKDGELGKRVLAIYGKDESVNRAELISTYLEKWPVKTDLEAGKTLFTQHCASCHQERTIQGEKVAAIGPSLEALNHWTNDLWVVSILDPSRSVDSKYRRVLIRTDSDEVIAGLKVRETDKEIEIITTDGRIQNIARSSVQEEKESSLSLMPDGFEKSLSPQQMADVVRYLRSSK
ncbi:MAG: c-type cytochrome, partial [Planctomycetes bacterium]|nr:c-type cytochrome [Planctomycetota bacterium]